MAVFLQFPERPEVVFEPVCYLLLYLGAEDGQLPLLITIFFIRKFFYNFLKLILDHGKHHTINKKIKGTTFFVNTGIFQRECGHFSVLPHTTKLIMRL